MKKIIVGLALLIIVGVGIFFIINQNQSVTVGDIFEDIQDEHGTIISMSLEDEDTLESLEFSDENSINLFLDEVSDIELETATGRETDSEDIYTIVLLTEAAEDEAGGRIICVITSNEFYYGNNFYTGDGVTELQNRLNSYDLE